MNNGNHMTEQDVLAEFNKIGGVEVKGIVVDEAEPEGVPLARGDEPEYKQPTKDEIMVKLAEHLQKADTEGFLVWIDEQLNLANTNGYTEGYNDAMEDNSEDSEDEPLESDN